MKFEISQGGKKVEVEGRVFCLTCDENALLELRSKEELKQHKKHDIAVKILSEGELKE